MFLPLSTYRAMRITLPGSLSSLTLLAAVLAAGCGGKDALPTPPSPIPALIASAYILPGAVSLNDFAFGDEPIVIVRSERLRWVNLDQLAHQIVADSPDATDFRN